MNSHKNRKQYNKPTVTNLVIYAKRYIYSASVAA